MDTVTETAGTAIAPVPAPALPAAPETNSLLPAIIQLAKDPQVDVAKLDALLKMQRELQVDQARQEATEAFTALSAELPRVKKNGTIDLIKDGKSKGTIAFAKWDDIDKVIRPLLVKYGFTLSFNSVSKDGGGLTVTGELMHRSGHVRTATIPLALDTGAGRNNLQAMGSTLSYGKRYCAEMLLNIVREGDDDDGAKGGVAYITPDQCEELAVLIRETSTDEKKFLSTMGVEELGQIAQAAFTAGKNMLLGKKQKKAS